MNQLPPHTPGDQAADDPLAAHRERVMYAVATVGVVLLLPFSIHDLLKGRNALGITILCLVVALAADALAIRLKKAPPIPYALLLVPMATAVTISLRTQGVIGAFWCYPAVLFLYFVLSRRVATVCSVALLVEATLMVYRYLGTRVTVRFFASLTLTIVIVNIIQSIIRDLEGRLLAQAITDPLTGAFNRRHMESQLGQAIEQSRRRKTPASLLVIDIDHFKRINDQHGHEAGDGVLKGIVSLVKKRARTLDLLFRMGGEEFVLLLPDTPEGDASTVAEDIRASIAGAPLLDGSPVTVSIGVGGLQPEESLDSWMKHADDALYSAKNAGRNRVVRRAEARGGEG